MASSYFSMFPTIATFGCRMTKIADVSKNLAGIPRSNGTNRAASPGLRTGPSQNNRARQSPSTPLVCPQSRERFGCNAALKRGSRNTLWRWSFPNYGALSNPGRKANSRSVRRDAGVSGLLRMHDCCAPLRTGVFRAPSLSRLVLPHMATGRGSSSASIHPLLQHTAGRSTETRS